MCLLPQVAAAIAAIEKIIETAASTPEAQNELKKNQLRMLATLNGTLRDDEGQACQNCNSPRLPPKKGNSVQIR
jgi:splicing factor 1